MATTRPSIIALAAWSKCSMFIATTQYRSETVSILDSVTLQQLQTLKPQRITSAHYEALVFSPDSRMLTCFGGHGDSEQLLVSWDLQTGGVVSETITTRPQELSKNTEIGFSIAHSMNGKMVGVLSCYKNATMILTYDVVSGIHLHSHFLGRPSPNALLLRGGPFLGDIPLVNDTWTHGESLRFATIRLAAAAIIIWEIGFASGTTPTEVEVISIPDNVHSLALGRSDPRKFIQFLPTLCRLAIAKEGRLLIWDARSSKSLLSHTGVGRCPRMSFSSGGRVFTCVTLGSNIYLWKESPTGYTLHGILVPGTDLPNPLPSPNGESIIAFGTKTVQLWHTKNITTTTSTQVLQCTADFILEFSPDGVLAVVAREGKGVVTVLDLKSGVPQLTIDPSIEVCGLRVTRNTVAVLGEGKMITWNLPIGNPVPNAWVRTKDSIQAITIKNWPTIGTSAASISPDIQYIALRAHPPQLLLYSATTGELLGRPPKASGGIPWFAPDGRIWCIDSFGRNVEVWTITENRTLLALEGPAVDRKHPPEGYPWVSSRGYQTTSDGWVFGPDGKRLLMLPPSWRAFYETSQVWNGRFLALLHGTLPELVILELDS